MIIAVRQIRKSLLFTQFDCLCNQRVDRSKVRSAWLGQDLKYRGDPSSVDDFQKARQFITKVRGNEIATITIRRLIPSYLIRCLTVVIERLSLPYWRVIVDLNYSLLIRHRAFSLE